MNEQQITKGMSVRISDFRNQGPEEWGVVHAVIPFADRLDVHIHTSNGYLILGFYSGRSLSEPCNE